ncbi:MAG: TlpA family protein disulfide reductase [Actinobacteria bacterium]|nr:TlpA family protein disulfide reductase [Actinomycetota bacterium]
MTRRRALLALAFASVAAVFAAGLVLARSSGDSNEAAPSSAMRQSTGAEPTRADGTAAPDLAGEDPVTGKHVDLAEFRGKPVVINVWASWCPGCNEEAVALREFAAAHPEAVVLGLDFQDTVEGAKAFYRKWGWSHPSIYDVAGTKTAAIGLVGLPTTYFLDERHKVMAQVIGATDRAGFERGLELAIDS